MFKATIEIDVRTSTNKDRSDPYNWWSVRLTSKHDGMIKNIVEQDFQKSEYDKAPAANQMLENQITFSDLIFGEEK